MNKFQTGGFPMDCSLQEKNKTGEKQGAGGKYGAAGK